MVHLELVIFIGLQATGKSTFYRARFAATHVLVSKDLMGRGGKGKPKSARQAEQVTSALAAGRSVVVDNTNPALEDRADLIALARAHDAWVAGYFFTSSLPDALERNRARDGKARVPDVALFATRKRLVPPSYAEGFDRLYSVRLAFGSEDGFEVREIKHTS